MNYRRRLPARTGEFLVHSLGFALTVKAWNTATGEESHTVASFILETALLAATMLVVMTALRWGARRAWRWWQEGSGDVRDQGPAGTGEPPTREEKNEN